MIPGEKADHLILEADEEVMHAAYLEEVFTEAPFGSSKLRSVKAPAELGKFASAYILGKLKLHNHEKYRGFSVTKEFSSRMLKSYEDAMQ
jgi:hypothetical protein